jgi:hypothetical protein
MFKKGDRVRLKKDFDPEGHRVSGAFVPQMDKYIGKTFIVEEVEGGPTFNYVLNDNWAFRFDWLELADDSQTESVCIGDDTKYWTDIALRHGIIKEESILQEADRILNGDRDADYGDPVENFKRISRIASAILNKDITDEECCVVMLAVKLARENYRHKRDNLVDLAGYVEILNRIKESEV